MRQIKRWRYYCDFCKKVGGQKYHIEKHERGCTANPNRICGLCEHCGETQPKLIDLTGFIDSYCVDLPRVKFEWDVSEHLETSGDKLDAWWAEENASRETEYY